MNGRCACGAVQYELRERFLIVHCCHCTACQRETGSGFAVNGLIETRHIGMTGGPLRRREIPSPSGAGQSLMQCDACGVTVWSHYSAAKDKIAFIRAGTLTDARSITPDIHIFTASKLPWVEIPEGAAAVPEYYRRSDYWPAASVARYKAALATDEQTAPAKTRERGT